MFVTQYVARQMKWPVKLLERMADVAARRHLAANTIEYYSW